MDLMTDRHRLGFIQFFKTLDEDKPLRTTGWFKEEIVNKKFNVSTESVSVFKRGDENLIDLAYPEDSEIEEATHMGAAAAYSWRCGYLLLPEGSVVSVRCMESDYTRTFKVSWLRRPFMSELL